MPATRQVASTGGGGSAFATPYVIFRAGVPSAGNHVETAAEVAALITANDGAITVVIDEDTAQCHILATDVWDCNVATIIEPKRRELAGLTTLYVDDGGQIRDLAIARGTVRIFGEPTATPSILLNMANAQCMFREGARFELGPAATVAGIRVSDSNIGIALLEGALIYNNASVVPDVIQVDTGIPFILILVLMFSGDVASDVVSGDNTLIVLRDGTCAGVPQTLWTGTTVLQNIAQARFQLNTSVGAHLDFGAVDVGILAGDVYMPPGFFSTTAPANPVNKTIPHDGRLRNLRVHERIVGSALGAETITYTLMVNNAPTALEVILPIGTANGDDLVNTVQVAAGDLVGVRATISGALLTSPLDIAITIETAVAA